MRLRATTEPCFSQHVDDKSLRNWKLQDSAGFLATVFSSVQQADNQVLAGWMPHMGIAVQANK